MFYRSRTPIIRRGLLGSRPKSSSMCLFPVGQGRVIGALQETFFAQVNRAQITPTSGLETTWR